MIDYYVVSSGRLVRTGCCLPEWVALQAQPGEFVYEGKPPANALNLPGYAYYDFNTGRVVDVRTLDSHKSAAWTRIKAERQSAEFAGFEWDGSRFDSDQVSQQRIMGAVAMAQLNPQLSVAWTLQDDSVRTLSAAEMVSVGAALGAHVQSVFAKGQALRAQIDAATTQAEAEEVVW